MKKALLVIVIVIIIIGLFNKYRRLNTPYIFELKTNDKIELHRILDFSKDSLYISKERFKTEIPLKDSYGSQFVHIRKGILKDSLNNIFFVTSSYNKDKKLYKITDNYQYEKIDISALDQLSPLYYTALPNPDEFKEFYYKLNAYENVNPAAANPVILHYKKEYFIPYFFENFSEIICWSLNPLDCSPRPRKAEYIIKIPLKNRSIKIKSEGFSDFAYLNVYYKNNPKTDDFILIEYLNSLWMLKSK